MIRVHLLGRFTIFTPAGEVVLPTAKKVRLLAAYLFWQQGRWVRRQLLREMLWGETDEARAAGNLRTALYLLRRAFGAGGVPEGLLQIRRDAVRAPVRPGCLVDARLFEEKASSEGREWVTLTGDDGSFAVALPAGEYSAAVTPPGCTTAVYKFMVSPEAEKNEFIKLVCKLGKPLLTLKEAKENLDTLLKMQSIPGETKPEETSSSGGGSSGGSDGGSEYADKEPPAAVSSNPADQETGVPRPALKIRVDTYRVSSNPADQETGVPVNSLIIISFNEAVQEGSNIGNVALRAGESVLDAVYAVNGDTLTITPSAGLEYNTEYTVVIPAGAVQDTAGNALEAEYTFGFTTEGEIYNLPGDFSGTQGQNNWYYYGEAGGYYLLHYDDYVDPWGTDGVDTWNTDSSRYLQIAPDFIQTGEGSNTAVGWQAPRAGTVSITGTMTIGGNYQGGWSDDGINFSIWKNSETIAGPVWVYHLEGHNTGTLSVDIDVAEGDVIYFYQDRLNWQDCDAASYDFTVRYTGEPAEEGY